MEIFSIYIVRYRGKYFRLLTMLAKTSWIETIFGERMMKANLHVFNIGHGAASLLQVQQDNDKTYNILIDGGPSSDLQTQLKAHIGDNTPLDLVILTHIHTDHCKGLISLFKEWKGEIRQLWIPYPIRVLQEIASALAGTGEDINDFDNDKNDKGGNDLKDWSKGLKDAFNEAKNRLNDYIQQEGDEEIQSPNQDIEKSDHVLKEFERWLENSNHSDLKEIFPDLEEFLQDLDDDIWPYEFYKFIHYIENYAHPQLEKKIIKRLHHYYHRYPRPLRAFILPLFLLFVKSKPIFPFGNTNAHKLKNAYHQHSKNKIDANTRKFVFGKSMASYNTLNNILRIARTRSTPVPIVQATSDLLFNAPLSSVFQLRILAPSYPLLCEIESHLKQQRGDAFYEKLYMVCALEAANVVGVAAKICIDDTTTILFPGDSDLQDIALEDFNSDILFCPHHGGHVGTFIQKYVETIKQDESNSRKTIVISKGKKEKGKRPSDEWVEVFQRYNKNLEVYCTNASDNVPTCKDCMPQKWQKSKTLRFSYEDKHWELKNENRNQRCKFLEKNIKKQEGKNDEIG